MNGVLLHVCARPHGPLVATYSQLETERTLHIFALRVRTAQLDL